MNSGQENTETELEITQADESNIDNNAPIANPGLKLSDAREHLGLNRAKVGQQLGLTETAVRNLEKNFFDHFSNSVYVRGYLKNYSKVLGLDEAEIIEAYDQYCLEHGFDSGKSAMEPLPEKTGQSTSFKAVIGLVLVVLLVVVGLMLFVFSA